MHCTWPGRDENNSLNQMITNDSNRIQVYGESVDFFGDGDDDELNDGWPSPARSLMRNSVWLCCSNERGSDPEQPAIRFRPISRRYSIIRTEPTSQSEIVLYQKLMNPKLICIT